MKKRVVLQMEGGLGKQVALTALISYFKERYEQVIVLSSYPDVFINNPNVYRAISYSTPYAFEEYFKTADDIFYPCGYRENDFRKRRIHLIPAACRSVSITYDEKMTPELYITDTDETVIKEVIDKLGNYIIIQSHGAHAPGTPLTNNVMAKDYPLDKMEKIVKEIHKMYPTLSIINYSLPNEVEIAGTIKMDYNWQVWFGLMKYCETFIAIDSSLQHISAAFKKKGIVLWGATNPNCFGWDHNVNLEGSCPYDDLHCERPYFVPSVDLKVNGQVWECPSKACMKIETSVILDEFKKFTIDTSRKPTMDFTQFTSMITKFGEIEEKK